MQRFIVLYCMPNVGMQEWMKVPEAERKAQEEDMRAKWSEWSKSHASALKETAGAGKTTRVSAEGSASAKNDVMLYSLVEAASAEEAAKMFEGHPHLAIPGAWIDVMPANVLPGME